MSPYVLAEREPPAPDLGRLVETLAGLDTTQQADVVAGVIKRVGAPRDAALLSAVLVRLMDDDDLLSYLADELGVVVEPTGPAAPVPSPAWPSARDDHPDA